MMLGLMMVWISVPVQAQNVIEDEGIETIDEEDVADSTLVDSLAADTLTQKLPWPESVKVGIDKLLESKMFETSQVGLMVWDLSADSCIYQRNERQLMRPASTMKLLTAITALDKLGGSYQFKTTLKYIGTIENGVLTGDVYCIGGMDPRFNSDDMSAFVNSLKEMGVDTIRGSIYADRSLKDADLLGEGWCWDDDNPVLSPLVFQRKDIFMDKFLAKLREEGIEYSCFGASEKVCPASAFTVCTRFHTMDQILHGCIQRNIIAGELGTLVQILVEIIIIIICIGRFLQLRIFLLHIVVSSCGCGTYCCGKQQKFAKFFSHRVAPSML